ncbi:MAG: 5'-deoxyadenosine deaminase [Firmicutes bacterium]|nr:5'-deoxyadenosine deaminase [Bacillota bacterium]
MGRTLISGASIVTMDPEKRVIKNGDILIDGDRIVGVGTDLGAAGAEKKIDARGKVVIPGLVQIHVHLCQALFRGLSDDLELMDWLKYRTWPLEASHDDESIYYSVHLGIAELLRGGTTSIVDMGTVHHHESAFRAIEESGIRAISGKAMMDWGDDVPKGLSETTEESLEESMSLAERWHGAAGGRIRYAFSPRFAVSCSERLLREAGELARGLGAHVHTHSSENENEIEIVERERGARNITHLDDMGLLGPSTIVAHCVHVDDAERAILARTGTHVAHCPSANQKLASGIAQVPEMLDEGINVGLGADGAGCNNNLDQFIEMRMAALIHKPRLGPTAMPALTVLEMATVRGARAMGLEHEIGSIEEGKKADLVLLDLARPHAWPSAGVDLPSRIVYSAHSSDVVLTMVDGKVLYEEGRFAAVDQGEILSRCDEAVTRLLTKAGLRG